MLSIGFSQNSYNYGFNGKNAFKSSDDCYKEPSIWERVHQNSPRNFKAVKEDFLYRGGTIQTQQQMDFLIHEKGIKSVLSLINPNSERNKIFLRNEIPLINNAKEKTGLNFDYYDCFFKQSDIYKNEQKYINEYAEIINKLPKPIYVHCFMGSGTSDCMEDIFRKANKQGLIILNDKTNYTNLNKFSLIGKKANIYSPCRPQGGTG
ncbi:MAG TPA: hypothetical protein P5556_04775 [Candidatus Gastranaerophilales bacterium]|nr:hypothetical protein [Candidatus Gastranaerophilales bacterium]